MAWSRVTLEWVGKNLKTKRGFSSKAYVIRRSGRILILQSGHIDVIGGRWYWRHGDHERRRVYASPEEAHETMRQILKRKLQPSSGYEPLPRNVRIHRVSRSASSPLSRRSRTR
jgi:hypothetical protein